MLPCYSNTSALFPRENGELGMFGAIAEFAPMPAVRHIETIFTYTLSGHFFFIGRSDRI